MGVKGNFKDTVKKGFEGRDLPTRHSEFEDDLDTVVYSLRLHKKRKDSLHRIFRAKGMDLSTGIRWVLYEWLEKELT